MIFGAITGMAGLALVTGAMLVSGTGAIVGATKLEKAEKADFLRLKEEAGGLYAELNQMKKNAADLAVETVHGNIEKIVRCPDIENLDSIMSLPGISKAFRAAAHKLLLANDDQPQPAAPIAAAGSRLTQ
jgi:hypothetical protein